MKNHKTSELQTVLTVTFVACFLIANILAGKQFQLPFGITMTGAVIIFPMTYILSDIFSEVYGYRWSRLTCYMAFGANILMAIVFAIAIAPCCAILDEPRRIFRDVRQRAANPACVAGGICRR